MAAKTDVLMNLRNCGFGYKWHFLILSDQLKNLKDIQAVGKTLQKKSDFHGQKYIVHKKTHHIHQPPEMANLSPGMQNRFLGVLGKSLR